MKIGCFVLTVALLGCGCTTSIQPNSGLPGDRWSSGSGISQATNALVPGTEVLPATQQEIGEFRVVRPSKSEQGVASGPWGATFIALVPEKYLHESPRTGPVFSPSLLAALNNCAPSLGSFPNIGDWAANLRPDKIGLVNIGGKQFIQYKIVDAKWRLVSSDTGRGYRVADFEGELFGSFRPIRNDDFLSSSIQIAYQAAGHGVQDWTKLSFGIFKPADITASCVNGGLNVEGVKGAAEGSLWYEGISAAPFNFVVDLKEGTSP